MLPSEIMGIEDEYTAFCFNEACAFIVSRLNEGDEPIIREEVVVKKVYKRPSELYNKFK